MSQVTDVTSHPKRCATGVPPGRPDGIAVTKTAAGLTQTFTDRPDSGRSWECFGARAASARRRGGAGVGVEVDVEVAVDDLDRVAGEVAAVGGVLPSVALTGRLAVGVE